MIKKDDHSIHIGDKNKIGNSIIGQDIDSGKQSSSEKISEKIVWKLIVPIIVVVVAAAVCLWLGLN